MERLNARRRRRRRPRPDVATITTTNTIVAARRVCAYDCAPNGRSSNVGNNAPAAINRKSTPGLWNTFQTPKIDPNTNHSNIATSIAVERRVHERVGTRVLRARYVPQIDIFVRREQSTCLGA